MDEFVLHGHHVYVVGTQDSDKQLRAGQSEENGIQVVRVYSWNGSAWITLGSGTNGLVRTLVNDRFDLYVGGFFTLLNPFALVGGLAAVAIFALHGAVFLALKTGGGMEERARSVASRLWLPAMVLVTVYLALFVVATDVIEPTLGS